MKDGYRINLNHILAAEKAVIGTKTKKRKNAERLIKDMCEAQAFPRRRERIVRNLLRFVVYHFGAISILIGVQKVRLVRHGKILLFLLLRTSYCFMLYYTENIGFSC